MDTNLQRDQELLILEAAVAADDGSPDFDTLLMRFGLHPKQRSLLIEKLRSRKASWRKAKSPIDSLRKIITRAIDRSYAHLELEESRRFGAVRIKDHDSGKSVWRKVPDQDGFDWNPDESGPTVEEYVRKDLLITIEPSPAESEWCLDSKHSVDWAEVARRANLDDLEAEVIQLMAKGTLYAEMQKVTSEDRKRELRAAWMRVERKLSLKIRSILEKV
jgi:hypothetical protein